MFKRALLLAALAFTGASACAPTVATAEDSPADVGSGRWVVSIRITAEDGSHQGPTWYFRETFDDKAGCDAFMKSEDWRDTFLDWAVAEIAKHDGKVNIPEPTCVQRREIQPYALEKGADGGGLGKRGVMDAGQPA